MTFDRERVLLITRNLPPLVGGMERLMQHTAGGVAQVADLTVIGPRGCRGFLPAGVSIVELDPRPMLFLPLSLWHGIRTCLSKRPHVVLGGSGLLGPVLLLLQWICQVRTAVYLHGLDIIVDHQVYQRLFVPSFRHLHQVIANSHNTANLAVAAGVAAERIEIIHPGTELPSIERDEATSRFRSRHDISAAHLLLFVGRVTPRKGLLRFVENSLPAVLEAEPDTCLVVVGDHPAQGLAAYGSELQAVTEGVERLGLSESLRFLGEVSDDELIDAYSAADVLVFPLVPTPGDVEGFGMVAIEAAATGTPTVAFAVGGVVDAVADGQSGRLVPDGDYAGFTQAILDLLEKPAALSKSSRGFAERFAWPRYHRHLAEVLLPTTAEAH